MPTLAGQPEGGLGSKSQNQCRRSQISMEQSFCRSTRELSALSGQILGGAGHHVWQDSQLVASVKDDCLRHLFHILLVIFEIADALETCPFAPVRQSVTFIRCGKYVIFTHLAQAGFFFVAFNVTSLTGATACSPLRCAASLPLCFNQPCRPPRTLQNREPPHS